jgi:hypothetical protein
MPVSGEELISDGCNFVRFICGSSIILRVGEFFPKILSYSGMGNFLLNRMLSERLRDRQKKQAHTEIISLKKFLNNAKNLLIFQG